MNGREIMNRLMMYVSLVLGFRESACFELTMPAFQNPIRVEI